MPPAADREAAWLRGDWDATWSCVDCFMEYYNCSRADVHEILVFAERSDRKSYYRQLPRGIASLSA